MRYASITDRLASLGSEKWAIHAEARRRKEKGEPIIELTIGEPDMPPHESLLAEATRAMHAGRYRYSNGRGEPPIVDALVRKYRKRRADVSSANVTDSGGFSKYNALQLEMRRRLANGFSANLNYTYAFEGGSQFDGFSFGRAWSDIPVAKTRWMTSSWRSRAMRSRSSHKVARCARSCKPAFSIATAAAEASATTSSSSTSVNTSPPALSVR